MSKSVEWNETTWLEAYPQFSGVLTSGQMSQLWQLACTLIDNTNQSLIPYDPEAQIYTRQVLLWAVMCHLATMSVWGVSGQSGTVASASEGSVSTSFALPNIPAGGVSAQWYNQTPCGRTAWMLIRRYSLGGRVYSYKAFHPYG